MEIIKLFGDEHLPEYVRPRPRYHRFTIDENDLFHCEGPDCGIELTGGDDCVESASSGHFYCSESCARRESITG